MIGFSAVVAALSTFLVCLAIRRGMLPFVPLANVNERSLHETPVRTSAGIAIVAGLTIAWLFAILPKGGHHLWPVMLGTLVLSATGLIDDLRELSARFRLGLQVIVVAALIILSLRELPLAGLLALPAGVALVWFINLFNFMDGSDGLAASQTVTAGSLLLLWDLFGDTQATLPYAAVHAALVCASLAFLWFNWPKASMFMGDAGSLAIPFLVAGLVLFGPDMGMAALIAVIGFAPFITDASLTLAIRILSGERWWAAHRSHAYQLVARRWQSHVPPLAALWIYGVAWLGPVSVLAMAAWLSPASALALAYLPVVAACAFTQWRLRRKLAG